MKKRILAIMACAIMALSACGKANVNESSSASAESTVTESTTVSENEESLGTIKLGGLKGPTSIGLVKLVDDAKKGSLPYSVEFDMESAPDVMAPKLLNGEVDIAALPVNMGSVLFNKSDGKVTMLDIGTLGILYILEKGDQSIKTVADLKGRTIVANGQGATPEYTLSYILSANGMDINSDVTIDWKSSADEVISTIENMDNAIVMLPQPFVTVAQTKVQNLNTVLDLTKEWDAIGTGGKLITSGLFVRNDFLEENKELVNEFIANYTDSVKWINENVEDASKLVEEYDIIKAPIAAKAIPYCNLVSITGDEMKTATEDYLKTLFDLNPKSVGEALPGEEFYYLGK
ncbi:ABC transporter substrate-binding protein [Lachnoanaerobaculum umeaense]|uniref:ABC transporter substrate-binding protein n=1 Tax=Lachnoanaerobaculum umeaense TaxID=617123 RepID=A0A385PYW5_9FIRM|nr:ABC transporter substrate-binding protein [Lachnoanaerobaculum umeaense]AYA98759.1 ABC transporter substrate-binding protein [Lachnoanaerobaculum umeaense]PZX00006.1 NitT/TauT family transport system substrate-binding protein [Lachnoanaerobaculum umeaense]